MPMLPPRKTDSFISRAVEIDQDRFELLRSNVRNTSKSCPSIRRVRYFNDDILRVLEQEREIIEARRPVFFLDPPWGGVDYKKQVRRLMV